MLHSESQWLGLNSGKSEKMHLGEVALVASNTKTNNHLKVFRMDRAVKKKLKKR